MNRIINQMKTFSVLEAFIPLLFYIGADIFFAASLIPLMSGLTLVVLELARRFPQRLVFAIYLLWLAAIGLGFWYALKIAPYWIWGVHILISETVRHPSEHQRQKPFLFGLKKYAKKRTMEFLGVLIASLISASAIYFLRSAVIGVSFWMVSILLLALMQMIVDFTQRKAA